MRDVLVDTSAFLALLDPADGRHAEVKATVTNLLETRARLFSTNFVRSEAYTAIGVRLGWRSARNWLRGFDMPLEAVLSVDEERAVAILLHHEDKAYSFVDATSFAVMERFGVRHAFALDRHFRQFGFNIVP